jgi:adenylate cyclase class IV
MRLVWWEMKIVQVNKKEIKINNQNYLYLEWPIYQNRKMKKKTKLVQLRNLYKMNKIPRVNKTRREIKLNLLIATKMINLIYKLILRMYKMKMKTLSRTNKKMMIMMESILLLVRRSSKMLRLIISRMQRMKSLR